MSLCSALAKARDAAVALDACPASGADRALSCPFGLGVAYREQELLPSGSRGCRSRAVQALPQHCQESCGL